MAEKRKRLTAVEAVELVLKTTTDFIGQRIDDFREEVHKDVERLERKVDDQGKETRGVLRDHDQQIASLCTIVKNGPRLAARWKNGGLRKPVIIGSGTVGAVGAIITLILKLTGAI